MGRPRKSPSMTDGKREIISKLIEEYCIRQPKNAEKAHVTFRIATNKYS